MGFYVNPGNETFASYLKDEIYVDKTPMLSLLNSRIGTSDKFICVSRPRRFGKTMASNMIAAYYGKGCDSSALFSKLKIASDPLFRQNLNKFDVLKLDMGGFWSRFGNDAIRELSKEVVGEFKREFKSTDLSQASGIAGCIQSVARETKTRFMVIIDEYDVLMRDEDAPESLLKEYLRLLSGLFKNDAITPCLALCYLTGILPIIKEKAQSKLNNFREFTILDSSGFSPFLGFTSDEAKDLCAAHSMSFEECKAWYDGYALEGCEIYDPRSVVDAMLKRKFGRYWTPTSSYRPILDVLTHGDAGIEKDVKAMISGKTADVNTMKYANTISDLTSKDNMFTYLCHLGYLAICDDGRSCRIPNHEIMLGWVDAMEDSGKYASTVELIRDSERLLKAAWACDEVAVAKALDVAHRKLTSPLSYNNEKSLQSAIRLAFLHADNFYTVIMECPTGNGFADLAFLPYKPNVPAMLIELKVRGAAQTGLDQIKERRYFAGLERYKGNILLVGISYDKKTKAHECRIEKPGA